MLNIYFVIIYFIFITYIVINFGYVLDIENKISKRICRKIKTKKLYIIFTYSSNKFNLLK